MKVAFYYHIPVIKKNNFIFCPSFIGVFIDSLGAEVDELYLIMHESHKIEEKDCDYMLKSSNITWINLGFKTPAWHRAIFNKILLKRALTKIDHCDALIVRSPSPLAPYFHKYISKPKLVFMVVGDYSESIANAKVKNFKDRIIIEYLRFNDYLFRKCIRKTDIMVNSHLLYEKYKNSSKSIHLIKTTTLSKNDFFDKSDTCLNDSIELLYTGRIDPMKGLFELLDAVANLIEEEYKITLNIVGWESLINKPVEKELKNKAKELKIENNVIFHGRKTVGNELNAMYRKSDIYVLPTHHEGFPRTIWEAMANGLPVITTDVGGIPSYLTNKENVIMIKPKNPNQIASAIKLLITDQLVRKRLISNGRELARENTLEIQSKRIVGIIESLL